MTRPSSLRPNVFTDTYADKITKLRVYRLEDAPFGTFAEHGDWPWQVDGFNENTHECTEAVANYASHAKAIADLPHWLADAGYEFEPALDPRPWVYVREDGTHATRNANRHNLPRTAAAFPHMYAFAPRPRYSQTREDYPA